MKPSNFLKFGYLEKEGKFFYLRPTNTYDLDKRFIDKEELKDMINNKMKHNPYKNDMCIALYNRLLEDILELLKDE